MKKVLLVSTYGKFFSDFELNDIKILREMGYEVWCAGNFEVYPDRLPEGEVKKVHFSFSKSPFSMTNVKEYKRLRELMQKEQFSMVHCHMPMAGVYGRLAAHKTKTGPVVYTAHGFQFVKGGALYNWIFYPVEKHFSRYTDLLITINNEDYQRTEKFHMKDRLHLPGVGIDLKKMEKAGYERNAFLSELKIPEDALVMLSVAEFTGRKNLGAAIRAMSSIPEPALHYLICGTGPLEEELKSLVEELGLTKRVHFLGQRSDIYDIVKAVDFFCFPSIREGLPVALMEAMAAGLPAVCRNTRGNNDLIDEKGGVFFEEPDAASVQRAIETMLGKRKKWPAMGEHNREKIKDYDISRVDQIMRATYRGLLGKDD